MLWVVLLHVIVLRMRSCGCMLYGAAACIHITCAETMQVSCIFMHYS